MSQFYIIKDVKRGNEWGNSYGNFQSYSLSLEGLGEPVSLNKAVPVKDEPEVGQKLYGSVEMLMSKAGKTYYKFKTEKEPDDTYAPQPQNQPQGSYEGHSDKEDSIARAVALKASVEYLGRRNLDDDVLGVAELFLGWLKSGSGVQPRETQGTTAPGVHKEASSAAPTADSGYNSALAWADHLRQPEAQGTPEPPEDLQDFIDFSGDPNENY